MPFQYLTGYTQYMGKVYRNRLNMKLTYDYSLIICCKNYNSDNEDSEEYYLYQPRLLRPT